MTARPTWDEYFMKIAALVSERSTCMRRRVGAIIVNNKRIISTGYNGAPRGLQHCLEVGCLREQLGIPSGERQELCRGAHAEQNAIIQAASSGVSMEGATMYCTTAPCATCAKMILNAGIKRLVLGGRYPDALGEALIKEAGLETEYQILEPAS
jgi:dCMP deaminase